MLMSHSQLAMTKQFSTWQYQKGIKGLHQNRCQQVVIINVSAYGSINDVTASATTYTTITGLDPDTSYIHHNRRYQRRTQHAARQENGNNFREDLVYQWANSCGFVADITLPDTVYSIIKDWNMTTFTLFIVTADTEVPVSYILPSVQEITILTEQGYFQKNNSTKRPGGDFPSGFLI